MEQRQSLVQQQRLALSPQLVQSIKLMAMPFADLRDRILEEVEKNPALEIVSDPFAGSGTKPPPVAGVRVSSVVSSGGDDESDAHQDFIEGVPRRPETLQDHLLAQLGEMPLDADVRALAELVAQNLDRDGFHVVPPAELPGGDRPAVLSRALDAVRRLDPVGCATSGFQESLVCQARLLYRTGEDGRRIPDPLLDRTVDILENHFDFLAKGRPDALVKAYRAASASSGSAGPAGSIDLDEAEGIFSIIRSLDPFPGRAFDDAIESWVVPDVSVIRTEGDGGDARGEGELTGFSVVINDEEIPVVGVSPFFMELGGSGAAGEDGARAGKGSPAAGVVDGDKRARDFARESVKEAQWFIHTIERRNLTILKLVRALVVAQRDFFLHGPKSLVPLRMKDIAAEIGMHEATVSRAANGKYLQCEWGVFELKYFFSNEVSSSSKQGVKELIREIVEKSPVALSDQKISDELASRGIKVARRTVAKYRGELTIGSSFDRP